MLPLEAAEAWLQQVVVGQNFCPFAGKPLVEGEVLIVEIPRTNSEEVLLECYSLLKAFSGSDRFETALFVLPKGYDDFFSFLDLADGLELLLEESFDSELSLATFHPEYQFADLDPLDMVHHIHRSPYPILHILRETSIESVRNTIGDTSAITERNQKHAASLGLDYFKKFIPK